MGEMDALDFALALGKGDASGPGVQRMEGEADDGDRERHFRGPLGLRNFFSIAEGQVRTRTSIFELRVRSIPA